MYDRKNRLFLTGMAALALTFGLVLTGCPTDSDDGGGGNGDTRKGVYIGLISFAGSVTPYNSGNLSYLDNSLRGASTKPTTLSSTFSTSTTSTTSISGLTPDYSGYSYSSSIYYYYYRDDAHRDAYKGISPFYSSSNPYYYDDDKGNRVYASSYAFYNYDADYNTVYYYFRSIDLVTYTNEWNLLDKYQKATQSGTALFYAVHKALANLTANESALPEDIDSVNLITFTDGVDEGSFGASNSSPIDGKSGVSSPDYAAYVKHEIDNRTIRGKEITAYSIGVKGEAGINDAQFSANLSNIASSEKSSVLTSFDAVQSTLTGIANGIDTKVSLTIKTPQSDPGTVFRMTFGVTGTTPADAEAATHYIDGTLAYAGGKYSLTNIQCSSNFTLEKGSTIEGTVSGTEVSFTFNGISSDSSSAEIMLWTKSSATAASWDISSEFSADKTAGVASNTTLVYLVLDASTSLSDYQVSQIKSAVNQFITTLYNRMQ